jgi:hypothetical protein
MRWLPHCIFLSCNILFGWQHVPEHHLANLRFTGLSRFCNMWFLSMISLISRELWRELNYVMGMMSMIHSLIRHTEDRVPRVQASLRQRLPSLDWGQLWGCHVSPWLGLPLLAQGSSRAVTCPHDSGQLRGRHVSLWLQHTPSGVE